MDPHHAIQADFAGGVANFLLVIFAEVEGMDFAKLFERHVIGRILMVSGFNLEMWRWWLGLSQILFYGVMESLFRLVYASPTGANPLFFFETCRANTEISKLLQASPNQQALGSWKAKSPAPMLANIAAGGSANQSISKDIFVFCHVLVAMLVQQATATDDLLNFPLLLESLPIQTCTPSISNILSILETFAKRRMEVEKYHELRRNSISIIGLFKLRKASSRHIHMPNFLAGQDSGVLPSAMLNIEKRSEASEETKRYVIKRCVDLLEGPASKGVNFFIRENASAWVLETAIFHFESAIFLANCARMDSAMSFLLQGKELEQRIWRLVLMAWSSLEDVDELSDEAPLKHLARPILVIWARISISLDAKPFAQLLGQMLENYARSW
ncbi:hypothetical protein HJFPF1_04289 [Paramyrothecium foliicola]|nr:hypothetical protein HJFPF1_04289 [Paramyrothecium foliicola]